MRHHLEILAEIDKLLLGNGLEDEGQELEDEVRASFSGSELCLRSASKLLTLQRRNKRISSAVGHQIKELVLIVIITGFTRKLIMKIKNNWRRKSL